MAEAFLQFMLEKLDLLIRTEVGLMWGVDKEMKRLASLLSTIQAVLEDAEEKQIQNKALQNWLRKLKDAAYKVDDILDECATEAARLESVGQNSSLINKVRTSFLSSLHPHNMLFRRKIGSRMRNIRERLDEIAEERLKFHLIEGGAERRFDFIESRQTGSILTQSQVYGRDEDKARIVECLVEKVADSDGISVYPIVGLGGLGKTTLAQMVFNDERIKSHFELRIWVCVSEDFSVKRVIKAIIESATGASCEVIDLDPLQKRLQNILNRQRYLLVLDDVWNENEEKWDGLKYVLACGSRGASIIVTTRSRKVASIMGTESLHQLSGLMEDDCWSLFSERAFRHGIQESSKLVALGKEIVKKCGGVPLAIKSLGSMMSYKTEENQWLSVVESEFWNLPQHENSILPALRLSYNNLPSKLRQCFSFCALFPKDFVLEKELLIQLWLANNFIPFTEKLDPEDIGNEICNELCWRSFFEDLGVDYDGYTKRFKMHDLVHDLAQFIMEDECLTEKIGSSINISKRTLHYWSIHNSEKPYRFLEALYQVETLRTFLTKSHCSGVEFSCDFSRLSSLRVYSASHITPMELKSLASHLKHLRYLDLSFRDIQILPKSICTLFNLQTLKLSSCYHLQKLPKHMRCLKNLRHLYLDFCDSLSEMPPKIGQITCLKTLSCFVVSNKKGCHLSELKGLNLGGRLLIKHLQRVKNPLDVKEVNLVGKRNLHKLSLLWENESHIESQEDVEKVLEAIQPHPSLKQFSISGYKGIRFPFWMRDNDLNSVVDIRLSDCHNCSQLPPLATLPSLRHLALCGMSKVIYIDDYFQGGGMIRRFPSLQRLSIIDLPSLKRFSREDGRELLPCLKSLEIRKCPKLMTLPHLPSVDTLHVSDCNEALGSISNLENLVFLSASANDHLVYLPHGMLLNLTSLNKLHIYNFEKLKCLPTELAGLSALETLHIYWCNELESFPEQGMEGLKSLKYLCLQFCGKFTSLTGGLQHLSCLETLSLIGCPELVAFPDGIKYLSFLHQLEISGTKWKIETSRSCPSGFKPIFQKFGRSNNCDCTRRYCHCVGRYSPKLAILPEALQYVPALQSLYISGYPNLASLPNWLGDLTSLQTLIIYDCPKLSSLPASIQGLTNLQKLAITECPELVKQCEKDTGEDWYKIAHIPDVYVEDHHFPVLESSHYYLL